MIADYYWRIQSSTLELSDAKKSCKALFRIVLSKKRLGLKTGIYIYFLIPPLLITKIKDATGKRMS